MNQCSVLYIRQGDPDDLRVRSLRALGFRVDGSDELPANEALAAYHAVIVRPGPNFNLAMLAARLRAKRHFGRRVLLALVPEGMTDREKRVATLSGFNDTMPDSCGARDLAAAILRLLRPYPEFRCVLRWPGGRRKAA